MFSFFDQALPGLADVLTAAGFVGGDALPVLAAAAAAVPPPVLAPEMSVEVVGPTAPLALVRANLDINALGFDPSAARATDADAQGFQSSLIGCRAVTLRWQGGAAAGGMFLPIQAGVSELVGIATLAQFRRRGLARCVTAVLAQEALRLGADLVFLVAASAESAHVYERAGFRRVGERLTYHRRAG